MVKYHKARNKQESFDNLPRGHSGSEYWKMEKQSEEFMELHTTLLFLDKTACSVEKGYLVQVIKKKMPVLKAVSLQN